MKRTQISILAVLAALAVSCTPGDSQLHTDVQTHRWELTRLTNNGVDENLAVLLPDRIDLSFEGTRGRGHMGVNSYELQFQFNDPDEVVFPGGDGGVTEMGGPPELMDLDTVYLEALFKVDTASVAGATLVLESPTSRLEYTGLPPYPAIPDGDPEAPVSQSREEGLESHEDNRL